MYDDTNITLLLLRQVHFFSIALPKLQPNRARLLSYVMHTPYLLPLLCVPNAC